MVNYCVITEIVRCASQHGVKGEWVAASLVHLLEVQCVEDVYRGVALGSAWECKEHDRL